MLKSTTIIAGLSMLTMAWWPTEAVARTAAAPAAIDMHQAMRRLAPNTGTFGSKRRPIAPRGDAATTAPAAAALADLPPVMGHNTPATTLGPFNAIYDMDGPDGQLWYYTRDLRSLEVEVNEYYTDYILQEYTFNIYDAEFNLVGTIHDRMRYKDHEVRVPGPENGIDLLPVITRHYFNDDDLYEVVVSLAVNTDTEGRNNFRSVVYSIGGEREAVTIGDDSDPVQVDKPVTEIPAFIADVLSAPTAQAENLYVTFVSEHSGAYDIDFDKLMESDPEEMQRYWDALVSGGYRYTTYGRADSEGNLTKVFDKFISYQTAQGDMGEYTPPVITLAHDGQAYIVTPHYEDTYFMPYYSPFDDTVMREDNSLVVEMYRLTDTSAEEYATFKVPMTPSGRDEAPGTFYSVGDLRYAGDILWDAEGRPLFIVTRCDYNSVTDSNDNYCYYLYDSNGNKVNTIFERAESTIAMSDIDGFQPQQCFVMYDEDFDERHFCFVNLLEGYNARRTVRIAANQGDYDDPDMLYLNVDRVAMGDTYRYAFEMRTPIEEDGNTLMRIAWFNADGTADRVDLLNMGPDIYYATAYIESTVLDPYLVVDDETPEYIILVKRGIGVSTASQEEFMILRPATEANPDGDVVMHLTPDAVKGSLSTIGIYPGMTPDSRGLFVRYYNEAQGYTGDYYALPLSIDSDSLVDITDCGAESAITYDGRQLRADGVIAVYDINGHLLTTGNGAVSVASMAHGVYIAVCGGAVNKFTVK